MTAASARVPLQAQNRGETDPLAQDLPEIVELRRLDHRGIVARACGTSIKTCALHLAFPRPSSGTITSSRTGSATAFCGGTAVERHDSFYLRSSDGYTVR